ncbi:MAG: hypothetical protein IJK00_01565 [Clostridia bacterium]|nr:hypothetical protein [Clostridia bacterium]
MNLYEIFETMMIVCFGISWPFNVIKSLKTRSAKGKSILFLSFILLGYVVGITSKFLNRDYLEHFSERWYVLTAYIINFVVVLTDFLLYFRNRKLDKLREEGKLSD